MRSGFKLTEVNIMHISGRLRTDSKKVYAQVKSIRPSLDVTSKVIIRGPRPSFSATCLVYDIVMLAPSTTSYIPLDLDAPQLFSGTQTGSYLKRSDLAVP